MSEKDFENQFDPESGYSKQQRSGGPAIPPPPTDGYGNDAIPLPPIEDDGGAAMPPPPTVLSNRGDFYTKDDKAESDQNGDAIYPSVETFPTENGTMTQSTDYSRESKPQKKVQKTPSATSAKKTTRGTDTAKKSGKQISSHSSQNSSASQQTQTGNNDASSLVWTILYYAMIMLLFPVYLLTHIILTIIYKALEFMFIDENNYPDWLFSSEDWAWEHLKKSFVLWRRFIVVAFVIIGIIVIIELIKK